CDAQLRGAAAPRILLAGWFRILRAAEAFARSLHITRRLSGCAAAEADRGGAIRAVHLRRVQPPPASVSAVQSCWHCQAAAALRVQREVVPALAHAVPLLPCA